EETLRSVADKGGGSYFHYIGNDGVIGDLARALRTMEAVEPLDDAGSVPDERSAPMVTIAVALLLLEWLISERRAMPSPRGLGRPAARRGRRILGIAIGSAALWAIACGDAALSNETANGLFAGGNYAGALAAYRDLQPGQQSGPGPRQPGSPNPGAQGPAQSGQPSAGASAQPGQNPGQPQEPTSDPTNSTDPNAQASPELRPALDDFRRGLTIDEALR